MNDRLWAQRTVREQRAAECERAMTRLNEFGKELDTLQEKLREEFHAGGTVEEIAGIVRGRELLCHLQGRLTELIGDEMRVIEDDAKGCECANDTRSQESGRAADRDGQQGIGTGSESVGDGAPSQEAE